MATLLASLTLSACVGPTPHLDRRIAVLDAEIAVRRDVLAKQAEPYRAYPGHDLQADVSSRPVTDLFDAYNALPSNEKVVTLQSYNTAGSFYRVWGDCWPTGEHGIEVVPLFDEAFAAALYVDRFDHNWDASGFAFRLKNSAIIGGILLGGRIKFCIGELTLPAGWAAIISYTHSAAGRMTLMPVSNEGIEYKLELRQPLTMWAAGTFGPIYVSGPILWKGELMKGKISNILGEEGEVRISELGEVRRYQIDSNFQRAEFLDNGLSVSGPLTIKWLSPPVTADGPTTPAPVEASAMESQTAAEARKDEDAATNSGIALRHARSPASNEGVTSSALGEVPYPQDGG